MTTVPGVPSPQEELPRHVIADMLRQVICGFECGEPHQHLSEADELIPLLAPLFAARVTAIERSLAGEIELRVTFQAEAERAEADLAAMTTKADTYQRMSYAEHGEIARELSESKLIAATLYDELQQVTADLAAAQERVAELTDSIAQYRAALERGAKDTGREIVKRVRAEQRVAAERKQAAAQAWTVGRQSAQCRSTSGKCCSQTNPYLAAAVPATPPKARHNCEQWQLQDHPMGGQYCGACGERWVPVPATPEEPPARCPRSDDVCDFPDCRCPRQATPEETTP